jgi:signal peptidase I
MKPAARRWLVALAILAGALFTLKSLVCGIYFVDTASMEPTILGLQGGERVLVVYDRTLPARFDVVVALRKGEDTPVVKRVVGLPGERVQIVEGDLLVNGRRLPPEAPRPRTIPVFDERWQDVQAAFPPAPEARPLWTRTDGRWSLAARSGTGARVASRLDFRGEVMDSYLDAQHALVVGETPVHDLALEFDLLQDDSGTRASAQLSEAGDVFELALEFGADGKLRASFLRHGEDLAGTPETLATRAIERGSPGWHRVRFSNIDNALSFERDGALLLQTSYAENRYARADTRKEGRNRLPRASFGGAGGTFGFRALRLERDLEYTPRGSSAVQGALDLGPDGCFLLGDNSSFSRDGREWGETGAQEIIGRAVRVLWPLGHLRAIEGALTPPALVR